MPKGEVRNEAVKYRTYKSEIENIINDLNSMKNGIYNDFSGRTQEEILESINFLRNVCNDLSGEPINMQTSLKDLYDDILQEERRQELIRREKEQEKNSK